MSWNPRRRRQVQVWPEEPTTHDDQIQVQARIEVPRAVTLSYRFPVHWQAHLTASADPFLIGTIFYAMQHATDLRVHGTVSPSLLRNLEEFQAAWHCWKPETFQPVEIQAETEREETIASNDETVMTFSGGLDSCFSAWRHTRGNCGRRKRHLTAALMAHGFDIPLEETDVFRRAAENSRRIVESVSLEFVPLACNFRQLGDEWEMSHGAALASCLHLFRKRFASGLIASSHVYTGLRFPWGSNPLTDVLLTTTGFQIHYDGCDFSRRQKAREVAGWNEAMERMRICWEGAQKDRNCGKCVRCVGTAICFALEAKPIPGSLPITRLEQSIRDLDFKRLKPVVITRFEELIQTAQAAQIREPWLTALEEGVQLHRGAPKPVPFSRKLRDRFAGLFHSVPASTTQRGQTL